MSSPGNKYTELSLTDVMFGTTENRIYYNRKQKTNEMLHKYVVLYTGTENAPAPLELIPAT